MKKKIRDITQTDRVKGLDGKYYACTPQQIHKKECYEVVTSEGSVVCSANHEWLIYLYGYEELRVQTEHLKTLSEIYSPIVIGKIDGPVLQDVKYVGVREVRCLETQAPKHLFEIYTDQDKPIFTSNCQNRVVAGRVNSTQSMMALGNTLGTAIRGDIKGRGIVSVNGILENCQIYFENPSWQTKWYRDRGMDECGYDGTEKDEEIIVEGEEDITTTNTKLDMEFEDIHKEVNSYVEQSFRVLSES